MKKKSFKQQSRESVASVFMTHPIDNRTESTHGNIQDMRDTRDTQDTQDIQPYRINLKLNGGHKAYLERISWENKKSITQYINDLIAADQKKNNNPQQ